MALVVLLDGIVALWSLVEAMIENDLIRANAAVEVSSQNILAPREFCVKTGIVWPFLGHSSCGMPAHDESSES